MPRMIPDISSGKPLNIIVFDQSLIKSRLLGNSVCIFLNVETVLFPYILLYHAYPENHLSGKLIVGFIFPVYSIISQIFILRLFGISTDILISDSVTLIKLSVDLLAILAILSSTKIIFIKYLIYGSIHPIRSRKTMS